MSHMNEPCHRRIPWASKCTAIYLHTFVFSDHRHRTCLFV